MNGRDSQDRNKRIYLWDDVCNCEDVKQINCFMEPRSGGAKRQSLLSLEWCLQCWLSVVDIRRESKADQRRSVRVLLSLVNERTAKESSLTAHKLQQLAAWRATGTARIICSNKKLVSGGEYTHALLFVNSSLALHYVSDKRTVFDLVLEDMI